MAETSTRDICTQITFHSPRRTRTDTVDLFRGADRMLQNFLRDVLLMIVEQIQSKADLKQLCEVSKAIYSATVHKLYEDIIIQADNEYRLERVNVKLFLRTCNKPTCHLGWVRNIQIKSDFHFFLEKRCLHYRYEELHSVDFYPKVQSSFEKLVTSLVPMFEQLKEESLRNFSWEMGTCVPLQILGDRGYITTKQSSIESISLITGGACPINMKDENPIKLSAFRSLRLISWTGLRSAAEFDALSCALTNNSRHLKELRLDFVKWPEKDSDVPNDDHLENFFASQVLKLPADQFMTIFPVLKILSLSNISLENEGKRIAYAFNLGGLSSLTIRHCAGAEEFLTAVLESGQAIRLASLEIVCGSSNDNDMCGTVSLFLGAFQGLKDLFVCFAGPVNTSEFWRRTTHHKSTLTRFACHQRTLNMDEETIIFEQGIEDLDLSILPEDIAELDRCESQHPFVALNLGCIGLGCEPQFLKPILLPSITTSKLKILHIRLSGVEMDHFGRPFRGYRNILEVDSGEGSLNDEELVDVSASGAMNVSDSILEDASSKGSTSTNRKTPRTAVHGAVGGHTAGDYVVGDYIEKLRILKMPVEFLDFANWVFGPDGLLTLEVLAYGDFSYDGRFCEHNKIFCRQTPSIENPGKDYLQHIDDLSTLRFRLVRNNDRRVRNLLDQNAEFLGACPTELVMDD